MSTQAGPDGAAQARALGNEFYRAGKLLKAEEAYKKAASLATQASAPVSNLSAVRYEMGDYRGAIDHVKTALSLNAAEGGDIAARDKLYVRLVKCFLHLLDFGAAEAALSDVGNGVARTELQESIESLKALWAETPDELVLRKQVLDNVPRYRPYLDDIPEYYAVGHDQVEPLDESLGMTGNTKPEISILFAGSGDGRNLFSSIAMMALKEAEKRKSCFKHLHFTIMDLKPAALARVLIFFHIMARIGTESVKSGNSATDTCLAIAYLFCCQVIPPFAEEILQSSIKELIKKLESGESTTSVTYVPEQDRESIIRVLRQWQQPWHKLSKVADVRSFIEHALRESGQNTPLCFDKNPGNDGGPEVVDFEKLSTLLPPVAVVKRREPPLAKLIAEYRSTGKSKNLQQHIGLSWRVNNTLLDYDYADRNLGLPDGGPFTFEFHPVTAIQSMGALDPKTKSKTSALERLGEVFRHMSISAFTLGREKRLAVEMIIGEVTDVMDRIRYNVLDHRLSTPTKHGTLDPTTFPQTFDYVHMSNIPDYIGGHLTTFLAGRPLLKKERPSSLRFSNLLNPLEFDGHETFQSEYLLMYDTDRVSRHFLLTKRPGASPMLNLPPDLPPEFSALMGNPFLFEGYMVWDRISSSPMPFQKLLPKSQFDTWLYRHFLKICLPYPRPIVSRSPVHAPLNLTALIRLAVGMFEVGYPAHWLARIFSSICTGAITTTARPPTNRVSKRADIDAKTAAKTFCVRPWVAEFTTLLSIWRRLLPFGMDSLGGTLVPLGTIHLYSITFSPFPADHERLPHFILMFWNTEVGYSIKPPASIRSLLMGEESQGFVSSKDILERAIVCVDTFHYTTATRTAEFWMRADKMEEIMAGKWKAFIWRTDSWTSVTGGVDMSSGVVKGKSWTMLA